eukprot:TRINITY_DN35567_c0_g1_i1.p1 TRINITY_DN35567_c0_g1~~TRINITY_DN35567_c0_g1_i1.p1  ORF type:complete len:162 (-),score=29.62 TRINITY_DN35567_c0_g1_i1:28-513(-)
MSAALRRLPLRAFPGQELKPAAAALHVGQVPSATSRFGLLAGSLVDMPCRGGQAAARHIQIRQFATNWWKRYVDGRNPERPHGADVSKFLRADGIDPYLLSRDDVEDIRRAYLQEFNYFDAAKKAEGEERKTAAWERTKEVRAHWFKRWHASCALPAAAAE